MRLEDKIDGWSSLIGGLNPRFWRLVAQKGMYLFLPPSVAIGWFIDVRHGGGLKLIVLWFLILLFNHLLVIGLQQMINRKRPNFEKLSGYKMWIKTPALPSGHSAAAFCWATLLTNSIIFYDTKIGGIVFLLSFSLAGLIAFSRLVVKVHRFYDVLAGAILGTAIGIVGAALSS